MALIRTLMKGNLVTVGPNDPVAAVAIRMREAQVGAVLVLDSYQVHGIFTERDLVNRVVAAGRDPKTTKVGEVATREVEAVTGDTHVKDCARLLRDKRIRHLPIMEGGLPIGIVSARDFFEQLTEGFEYYLDQLTYERALADGRDPYDYIGGSYER
jgi:CBS domain-containing protein